MSSIHLSDESGDFLHAEVDVKNDRVWVEVIEGEQGCTFELTRDGADRLHSFLYRWLTPQAS